MKKSKKENSTINSPKIYQVHTEGKYKEGSPLRISP